MFQKANATKIDANQAQLQELKKQFEDLAGKFGALEMRNQHLEKE